MSKLIHIHFLTNSLVKVSNFNCSLYAYWYLEDIFHMNPRLHLILIWIVLFLGNLITMIVLILSYKRIHSEIRHMLIVLCLTHLMMGMRNIYMVDSSKEQGLNDIKEKSLWKIISLFGQVFLLSNNFLFINLVCYHLSLQIKYANLLKGIKKYYSRGRIYLTVMVSFLFSTIVI